MYCTMLVYNYHPDTKVYLSTSEADSNPLEPGSYFLPAWATFIPVIDAVDGYDRVFNEEREQWELQLRAPVVVAEGDEKERTIEDKWSELRMKRNMLLAETDWMFIVRDYVMSPETELAWKNYRQALRDITNGLANPDDAIFPEKPQQ